MHPGWARSAGGRADADEAARTWVAAHRRRLACTGTGALGVLVALWFVEYHAGGLPGQRAVYDRFRPETLSFGARPLTQLAGAAGSAPVALVTVLVLAAVLGRRLGGRAAFLVVACAGVVVPEAALNAVLGPTPAIAAVDITIPAGFPSGHVAYATAVFGALASLALMRGERDLAVLAAALALLMGPARVLAGVHLVSDVLAGYALGLVWLTLALLFVWHRPWRSSRTADP